MGLTDEGSMLLFPFVSSFCFLVHILVLSFLSPSLSACPPLIPLSLWKHEITRGKEKRQTAENKRWEASQRMQRIHAMMKLFVFY